MSRRVAMVLPAVLVLLAAVVGAGCGGTKPQGDGELPAATLARLQVAVEASGTTFSPEGQKPGPPGSGETWSVYRSGEGGSAAWVYLDAQQRLRRVDNFSSGALGPAGSFAAARSTAATYVAAVGGPPLGDLKLRTAAKDMLEGRPTTVAWQERRDGVWLPHGVIVSVTAREKVVGYQWVATPVTVALAPNVTAQQAATTVAAGLRLKKPVVVARDLEVIDIDPDDDGTTTQYLVWNLELKASGASGPAAALAVVDAHGGQVLSATRLE